MSGDREEKAGWVRENLPASAEFAAAVRAVFPTCRLTYAAEGGNVVGQPGEEPAFSVSGDQLMNSIWHKEPRQ